MSIGCFMAFNIIGSSVDENGILIEPFALLPIGYALLFVSVIAGVVVGVKGLLGRSVR